MKKIITLASAVMMSLTIFAADEPNEKVLEAFNKTFELAKDVSWIDVDRNFEASFKQNNVTCRVAYDEEGNVLRSIRYYKGEVLPLLIQSKLSKIYKDQTVFGVTEVSTSSEITYHIILEDKGRFYYIESDSFGNMAMTKKLTKA
jgi:hypothetical protein